MLGGLCITRKACRPMDDESPDDASGIVSNCSTSDANAVCSVVVCCNKPGDEVTYILGMPPARLADSDTHRDK